MSTPELLLFGDPGKSFLNGLVRRWVRDEARVYLCAVDGGGHEVSIYLDNGLAAEREYDTPREALSFAEGFLEVRGG